MKTELATVFAAILITASASVLRDGSEVVDERVVGGQTAGQGVAPYQVSLRDRAMNHVCGGSILGTMWILTASHCVVDSTPALVIVGSNYLKSGGTAYNVAKVLSNPQYDAKTMKNDIAMIKTASAITFTQTVQPIALPSSNTAAGSPAILTGWGITTYPGVAPNDLQIVKLTTMDGKSCQSRVNFNVIFDTQICTITKTGQGACHGDSGGPLVSNGKLIGVVSFGMPCAKGYPDVYTRVFSYINWIQRVANSN